MIRSAIIPYYTINNKTYFLLFIDAKHNTLIDGGGHIDYNELNIDAAIREMKEESIGLINLIDKKNELLKQTINDNHNIYFFYDLKKNNIVELCRNFRQRFILCKDCDTHLKENSYMIWIEKKDLIDICNNKKVQLPIKLEEIINEEIINNQINYYPTIYPILKEIFLKMCTYF